jgi:succinate dehydrogenase / fumarate reductase, membrane anchor subunit
VVSGYLMGGRGEESNAMSARPSNMRTPLGRVRGYGSAKSGTEDFIRQRLTAIANIPLTIAVVLIVITLIGRNHAAVVQILGSTPVAITMVLFLSFRSSIT